MGGRNENDAKKRYSLLSPKADSILQCLDPQSSDAVDLWHLRTLALTRGGLLDPTIRRRAWPKLVGVHQHVLGAADPSRYNHSNSSSFAKQQKRLAMELSEQDISLIRKDVGRSVWHVEGHIKRSRKERNEATKKQRLQELAAGTNNATAAAAAAATQSNPTDFFHGTSKPSQTPPAPSASSTTRAPDLLDEAKSAQSPAPSSSSSSKPPSAVSFAASPSVPNHVVIIGPSDKTNTASNASTTDITPIKSNVQTPQITTVKKGIMTATPSTAPLSVAETTTSINGHFVTTPQQPSTETNNGIQKSSGTKTKNNMPTTATKTTNGKPEIVLSHSIDDHLYPNAATTNTTTAAEGKPIPDDASLGTHTDASNTTHATDGSLITVVTAGGTRKKKKRSASIRRQEELEVLLSIITSVLKTIPALSSNDDDEEKDYLDEEQGTDDEFYETNIATEVHMDDRLHYYQGLHDLAALFLINLESPSLTSLLLIRLSTRHLRDAMRSTFDIFNAAIKITFLPLLCEMGDVDVHNHIVDAGLGSDGDCTFALSWLLSWFSHDVLDLAVASRLIDCFLASHPLMPIYVSVALLSHPFSRERILNSECDVGPVYMTLSSLIKDMQKACSKDGEHDSPALMDMFEDMIADAIQFMNKLPPSKLLHVSKEYYGDDLEASFEMIPSIAVLMHPPEWSLAPTAPTDWALIREARAKRETAAAQSSSSSLSRQRRLSFSSQQQQQQQQQRYPHSLLQNRGMTKKYALAMNASGTMDLINKTLSARRRRRRVTLVGIAILALAGVAAWRNHNHMSLDSSILLSNSVVHSIRQSSLWKRFPVLEQSLSSITGDEQQENDDDDDDVVSSIDWKEMSNDDTKDSDEEEEGGEEKIPATPKKEINGDDDDDDDETPIQTKQSIDEEKQQKVQFNGEIVVEQKPNDEVVKSKRDLVDIDDGSPSRDEDIFDGKTQQQQQQEEEKTPDVLLKEKTNEKSDIAENEHGNIEPLLNFVGNAVADGSGSKKKQQSENAKQAVYGDEEKYEVHIATTTTTVPDNSARISETHANINTTLSNDDSITYNENNEVDDVPTSEPGMAVIVSLSSPGSFEEEEKEDADMFKSMNVHETKLSSTKEMLLPIPSPPKKKLQKVRTAVSGVLRGASAGDIYERMGRRKSQ